MLSPFLDLAAGQRAYGHRALPYGGTEQAPLRCLQCGYRAISYNFCRNRQRPKCQTNAPEKWLYQRQQETLPAGCYHLVFNIIIERLQHSECRVCFGRRDHSAQVRLCLPSGSAYTCRSKSDSTSILNRRFTTREPRPIHYLTLLRRLMGPRAAGIVLREGDGDGTDGLTAIGAWRKRSFKRRRRHVNPRCLFRLSRETILKVFP